MLLGFITILVMLGLAFVYLREGLFTAFLMAMNVLLAGLVAFNFWEPPANLLEQGLAGSFLAGCEDFLCLAALFCVTLGVLRTISNALANAEIGFPDWLQRAGGAFFGLVTGYLVSGILVCMLQTLPWQENFLGFEPRYDADASSVIRQLLPPDRTWLALLFRAGAYPLANREDPTAASDATRYDRFYTFDRYGTFEARYAHYRRYGDGREPAAYQHEFDKDLLGP
jgi:uncharacterized membrane protein required for colicin V production